MGENMQQKRQAILIVDDEAIVLHSAKRLLQKKGFEVLTASNGMYAMDILKRSADTIGAILLDISMPEMDGEETLERIMEIDPGAKVILCSGYARTRETESLFKKGAVEHIQKPFEINELLTMLTDVLGK